MPAIKFTQRKIESLIAQRHTKRVSYTDPAWPGLHLIVGPRGGVWYFFKRIDGKQTRLRLGDWPTLGIAQARAQARDLEVAAEEGKHPKAELARQAEAASKSRQRDRAAMVKVLAAHWQQERWPHLAAKTRESYEQALRALLAAFGDRDAATLTHGELRRFLAQQARRSWSFGNQAASVVRQVFQHGVDFYDLPINPAAGIKNPSRPKARTRTLSRDEIRVLWRACELAGYPYGSALQLALCTGQRIGEIGAMKWADVDGEYWANVNNKAKRRIDIYLAPLAREVLDDCPHISAFVFNARGEGLRSDTWAGARGAIARHILPRIEEAAEQLGAEPISEHWTAHDLRRTVRTGLTGWAGVLPDTAERVLNHALGGLRAHYDFADYKPHVTQALQDWDEELRRIRAGLNSQLQAAHKRERRA